MKTAKDLPTTQQRPRYLTEKEVSVITGRKPQTLRNDRHARKGLPYRKIGRLVRYREDEVFEYMESGKISFEEV